MKITKELREYMKKHPLCEACGRPAYGLPHHIRHRASGGGDDPSNLLRLCADCHYGIVHGPAGIKGLIETFPHLREKILKVKPALAVIITKQM
jgi:hypothetical protein